ncbi:hypothetical protein K9B35_00195 [Sphingomonas sp. R647]|uniref:hypothetical protein n=1 Tax=Sphingomonas sp. R647 TaxID=2875233 RepID=UPI001CD1F97B|nr:hypothetical protein [Sphingomonas sp. R647]MCA1196374.1 hypothetical protein [Sphingomonas sp. R647]
MIFRANKLRLVFKKILMEQDGLSGVHGGPMYRSLNDPADETANVALSLLQDRLETTFKSLWDQRKLSRRPVFALEHGLSTLERARLQRDLRAAVRQPRYRPGRHWLAWIVYAAELAYHDDGVEYWRRFDTHMPGCSPSLRTALRDWFETFASSFGGYRPVGRWAQSYPIISWPHCHALLPRDLHWQLGRTLYEFRYELPQQARSSPAMLGRFIARMNRGGSSRFENLLEQEMLVGLLVQALVARDAAAIDTLHPAAIKRLLADIGADAMAAAWFDEVWSVFAPRH